MFSLAPAQKWHLTRLWQCGYIVRINDVAQGGRNT